MSDKPASPSPAAASLPPDADHGEQSRKAFGHTFWMLNSIEMFERLAYFGIRAVVPLYIMQAAEPGGLHLTALHKGTIYAWWAVFQSFLPIVTGGIADRYGYKRVLLFAILMNVTGYVMMANLHSYLGFFAGVLVLATGTAFFKPSLQGSIAQNLTKRNSSLGWGVFYWVVNVGAFAAPFVSTLILGKPHSAQGWQTLFYACAAFTACNLVLLLTFKDVPSGASKTESPLQVLKRTIVNIFEPRLIAWLLIMSCFWLMMYQLWDLHPNFITDWVDSSAIAAHAPAIWQEYGDRGLIQVPQQILLNLNAGLIILLIVPLSWAARKMRTLSAMLVGMSVATCGVLIAGLTANGWILLLGIAFFSLGEMWTGPKKNEYLSLIAPPGKKGLYLGYVNIPVGIGLFVGSYMAGFVYDNYGEKAGLALKEMAARPQIVAKAARATDWSDSLEKIPPLLDIERDSAFIAAQTEMGADALAAARRLRENFRQDQGQIENLALQYVATHPDYRKETIKGFTNLVKNEAKEIGKDANALVQQVDALLEPDDGQADNENAAPASLPAASSLPSRAEDIKAMVVVVQRLVTGEAEVGDIGVARFSGKLEEVTGKKRTEAFGVVRDELVNKDVPEKDRKTDADVIALLWARFGDDPDVLNNLALEYLAQATPRVHDAVATMEYEHPADELHDRIKEIEKRIGIGRTKSFTALSAALGADDAAVDTALEALDVAGTGKHDRLYAYLVSHAHIRFIAVARKDWANDLPLLREMIRHDQAALDIVLAEIDQDSTTEKILALIKRIFGSDAYEGEMTEEGVNYTRLAGKQELIIKALDAKDWTRSPELIPPLMRLNPFEARALASAEVAKSPLTATQMLWDKYDPQYKVWIPFAAIGVFAAIALAIFGHKAKKWADMNA